MKTKKARNGFTQIPNELITNWSLSNDAFRMYLILLSHDLYKINYKVLYTQLGVSISSGSRIMKELLTSNLVKRNKFKVGNKYEYQYFIVDLKCSNRSTSTSSTSTSSTSKLATIKNTNIKEEQSVPFEEDAIKSPLQAVLPSFFNEDEKTTIPSLKELLPRVVLELTEETTGFNPNVNPLEAVEALETLKKQMALDGSITAPDSGRKFNLLKYIETIKETI